MDKDALPWVDTPYDTPSEVLAGIKANAATRPEKPTYKPTFNHDAIEVKKSYMGVDQASLQKLFELSPDGTTLINRRARGAERKGDPVRYQISYLGYKTIKLKKGTYLLHKLIYLFSFGEVSVYMNPLDGDKRNTKADNWRPCCLNDSVDKEAYVRMRARNS